VYLSVTAEFWSWKGGL